MAVDATREPPIVPDAKGKVEPGKTATLVDIYDPVDTAWQPWFDAKHVSFGNDVVPYIDPNKLFKDMAAAIRTAKTPAHFVGLLAWNSEQDFELVEGDPSTTLKSLLPAADAMGVRICAMLYRQDTRFGSRNNTPIVTTINGLKHGLAVHDQRVMELTGFSSVAAATLGYSTKVGAHHQKVLLVNGDQGLIAFQGGIDIDPDRRSLGGGPGLHDVHTRLMGPAAWFLYEGFMKRWNEHPTSAAKPVPSLSVPANQPSDLAVQIAHTYPNGATNPGLAPGGYAFAASGDQSLRSMILRGIANSKEFIYVEDQYLVDFSVSNALKAALPNIKKLIILVVQTGSVAGELRQAGARRRAFIDNLGSPGSKISVCQLRVQYVHSKTWIFDDKFAVIGSANVNRRGMTHDSEQAAGIFDKNLKKRLFFAHELRMNLWAKHLKMRPVDLHDPIASSIHWFAPHFPAASEVEAFDRTLAFDQAGLAGGALAWDTVIDPDGS